MTLFLKRYIGRFVSGGVAITLLVAANLSQGMLNQPEQLEERFSFAHHPIPGSGAGIIRDVHPKFEHISAWISAVGAAIAVGDMDGDGRANDLCHVDPRDDSVTLRPALSNANPRYQPIKLVTQRAEDGPPIAPMGCVLADANADGHQDVIVYFWGRSPIIYYTIGKDISDGFLQYEIASGEVWYTNAGLFSDLDGDGYGDLIFGNYFPDESGVLETEGLRSVEMQHSMSHAGNGGPNRLFLSSGASRGKMEFTDRSDVFDTQMANGWTLALGAADLNGDGLPEVYIANDFGPDRMLFNASKPGAPTFTTASARRNLMDTKSTTMGKDSFKGMGVDFGDVDGDGRLDIFVSNIAEEYALHESHFLFLNDGSDDWAGGNAPYRNASGPMGLARSSWSWDAKFGDFDNDGKLELWQATGFVKGVHDRWPELHELAMGNDELLRNPAFWPKFGPGDDLSGDRPDAFFVRDETGRYHDLATEVGIGQPTVSRGIALADIDNDGDLDVALARQWETSVIYENLTRSSSPSLVLDLRLTNANGSTRPAIGAVVRAFLPKGREIIGMVDSSNGHSGARAPQVHFGLGAFNDDTLQIQVTWRSLEGLNERTFTISPGHHRIVLDTDRVFFDSIKNEEPSI